MSKKPYTIKMPNAWNFIFDFQIILFIAPFFYLAGFPQLYMHMWRQRARFYSFSPSSRSGTLETKKKAE
jgi:hypothetical protein